MKDENIEWNDETDDESQSAKPRISRKEARLIIGSPNLEVYHEGWNKSVYYYPMHDKEYQ